jgi:hypothetical protein
MAVPPTWDDISSLACRFDCISMGGGLARALDVADRIRTGWACTGSVEGSAIELQISLSFECRTIQHCGLVLEPGADDWAYLSSLYERVRGT